MKSVRSLLLVAIVLQVGSAEAAIWGEDNRKEAYEYPPESVERRVSRSVAMLVPWSRLTSTAHGVKLDFSTFAKESLVVGEPLCPRERFQDQPAAVYRVATGFLVSPRTLVTAGHVVGTEAACRGRAVVFGVEWDPKTQTILPVPTDHVFACEAVMKTELTQKPLVDYTLLKLDRPVTHVIPLPLRREGKIGDHAVTTMMGHPYGMPLKITGEGVMKDNSPETHFIQFLDTYPGNSGSPVVDARRGVVEGVLVEGETGDTTIEGNWPEGCWYSKIYCDPRLPFSGKCDDWEGQGAKVIRSTVFAKWIK